MLVLSNPLLESFIFLNWIVIHPALKKPSVCTGNGMTVTTPVMWRHQCVNISNIVKKKMSHHFFICFIFVCMSLLNYLNLYIITTICDFTELHTCNLDSIRLHNTPRLVIPLNDNYCEINRFLFGSNLVGFVGNFCLRINILYE